MKYAITGANGYLGSQAARRVLSAGHQANFVVRRGGSASRLEAVLKDFPKSAYHIFEYDGSADSLVLALEDADRVFHLAALYKTGADPETVGELVQSNIKYSADVFSVLQKFNSTARVASTSSFSSFAADGSYAPATVYAATKSAVEALAPAFALNISFLRLGDTFGPGDWRVKIHNLIRDSALAGTVFEPRSPRDQPINLTHVDDVLAALDHACALPGSLHGETRVYDLYYPENEIVLSDLVELMRVEAPELVVKFPLLGSVTPIPKQVHVLPGFELKRDLPTYFAKTIFGDIK